MRLILKHRFCGIIVLTIYLKTISEFISPTNGKIRSTSPGEFKQPRVQGRRLQHYLLLGSVFPNKARSPLIKSISVDEAYAKEAYTYEIANLQGKLINGVAPSESSKYHMDNGKQPESLITNITGPKKRLKEQIDQDSFDWKIGHVQRKLLFGVTSNNGAHGNDLSFTDGNQGILKDTSSVDIIQRDSDIGGEQTTHNRRTIQSFVRRCNKTFVKLCNTEGGQKLRYLKKKQSLGRRCTKSLDKFSDNLCANSNNYSARFLRKKSKPVENTFSAKYEFHNGTFQRKNASLNRDLISVEKVESERVKRDSNVNDIDTPVPNKGQAGREIYYTLVEFIISYLNMSKEDGNFTYSVAGVIEWKCPEVIDDLYRNVEEIDDGKLYCNSSWDEYSCWPRTLAGTFAIIPCPGYLPGIDDSDNATKYCNENGTWASKANYNLCLDEDTEEINEEDINARAVRFIYNIGFSLSTLTLVVALFIFLYFRSLRCLRNSIHCHLIVSFIFMNVMWIIMRHSLIPIQDSPHLWLIKVEVALFNYSQGTNFFWMFVEGLYLHIIIVWTYSADKIKLRYLFVIGWVLPAVFIVAWIIVMQTQQGESSWLPESMGENGAAYEYIYIAPILFVLFANIIFLSTIVWVLITKLRASHSLETRQYRKAVKATVILFPLLGITYVLFIVPPSDHPQVHIVFNYINAVLQSLQGFFVAVFYCFLNGEVKGVLKKRLLRYNDARSLSSKYTKTSMAWTRASRDYTTTVSFGNGAILNQNRRNNGHPQSSAEEIPLKSREGYDTEECVES